MSRSTLARHPKTALAAIALLALAFPSASFASEASLKIPDLNSVKFFGTVGGWNLLAGGMVICLLGLAFGLTIFRRLRVLPVHSAMKQVSETIYETCKTYLGQQLKFICLLELFIGSVLIIYFGFLTTDEDGQRMTAIKVATILLFSLIGIAGSVSVAWFGMRINTIANSRTAFAALRGKPFPCYAIPLQAGMSVGMVLISVELLMMLVILLFIPVTYAGPCFIGFAVGESLGAAALRVAGGIFTKIADIGADLMKIVFKVEEDDARNPGVIADCTGDNAGDSVGPTADGFETYGVTGVALITFILLAVRPSLQVPLLVWIFAMRLIMVLASGISYWINETIVRARYANAVAMDFEKPLTSLVYVTSLVSVLTTFLGSYALIGNLPDGLWWRLSAIITCGTVAGALIPEFTKIFTSVHSRHVQEIVTASREGGASLNILSGLVAGNFSAYWMGGIVIGGLMAVAYGFSTLGGAHGVEQLLTPGAQVAAAVFAFGLVAFGFLGMGPVTIAVDSYGPVTDNAQSVYELSLIETIPGISAELERDYNVHVDFDHSKQLLEQNDGAGNTFKATAKPVLIGTAVVGATTLIFSIIMMLTKSLTDTAAIGHLSVLYAPFLLGFIAGGAEIYWFTGASMQAVVTGAYRAVEFIKRNMKLEG
ncbi:MAG TPA: sodium-translocating pyrophosphatase, partial [Tepidisphaeraceae bacterium]|nr:sodium-translocating pyrophosphatase [Tepidisphaeraceae bacterium]